MHANNSFDALLSYGWVRSTYAALVNLSKRNLNVAVADSTYVGMCQMSRYTKKVFHYSDFLSSQTKFLEDIKIILDTAKPKVYLPSHDETEIIAAHKDLFTQATHIPIPALEQLKIANCKSASQQFATQHGIPTAKRICYDKPDELMGQIKPLQKIVIRLRKGNSAKGVFYATGPQDVHQTVVSLIKKYSCTADRYPVVQEYINGEGWGVSCLYWEGRRIAHFTHRRLREKTETGGTSTLREHQPNETLEQMAFTLLDKLQWHGLAMIEFKYDPVEKKGYFIEINPRLWGSIHLAISAGIEFPYLLYLCATDGPESAKRHLLKCTVKFPWRSRWYLGDLITAVNHLRRLRPGKALQCLLPGGTDTYDDIALSDPCAFLGEALYYGSGFIRHREINPVQDGMIG